MFDYARVYWNGRKAPVYSGGCSRGIPTRRTVGSQPPQSYQHRYEPNIVEVFLEGNDLWFPSGYYEDVPFTYPAFCLAESISLLDVAIATPTVSRGPEASPVHGFAAF